MSRTDAWPRAKPEDGSVDLIVLQHGRYITVPLSLTGADDLARELLNRTHEVRTFQRRRRHDQ